MADTIITRTLKRMPAKLYKYCGVHNNRISWIKRYLLDSELYFSSISAFNDPLDCRIPFIFDAPPELAVEYWKKIAAVAAPQQTAEEQQKRIDELIHDTKNE